MTPNTILPDLLWSLPLIVGMARIASAVMDWPVAIPETRSARATTASHLAGRVPRAAFGATLVALGLAGLFRHEPLWVQLPLWLCVAAMLLASVAALELSQAHAAERPRMLRRVSRFASSAVWAIIDASIAILISLLFVRHATTWLLVAGALLYLASRLMGLVEEISDAVAAASEQPMRSPMAASHVAARDAAAELLRR